MNQRGSRLNGGEPPHGAALRIGSLDNSVGLSFVNLIGEPSNQVAKSSLKFSAMNLQILSYMVALKKNCIRYCDVQITDFA